ncbi:MAG: hypothetical protein PVG30_04665 [Gammaproteobacteria bacterium]|jgi:hypothetical protein
MQNNDDSNTHFINLVNYLTQGNVKKSRTNTFNKTLKLRAQRSILIQLAQNIIQTKKKYSHYQQQLNNLSLELLELHQQIQNADAPEALDKLLKKYQQLIKLIMMGFAGSSSDGTTATLQMPIFNKHNTKINYTEITKKLEKLLQENIDANPNSYTSIGELVVNLIIGIFSFFMTDLENLDEETKNKLNKELTNYTQQKYTNIICHQTIEILNQLTKPALKPAPAKSPDAAQKNQPAAYSFLNPLNLQLRPDSASSSDDQK